MSLDFPSWYGMNAHSKHCCFLYPATCGLYQHPQISPTQAVRSPGLARSAAGAAYSADSLQPRCRFQGPSRHWAARRRVKEVQTRALLLSNSGLHWWLQLEWLYHWTYHFVLQHRRPCPGRAAKAALGPAAAAGLVHLGLVPAYCHEDQLEKACPLRWRGQPQAVARTGGPGPYRSRLPQHLLRC